ncbi:MAG: Spi family protease inhibitor [Tannerella sp.]|nr:Spi family protease inhibitor [Tannerella sp.]
MKKKLLTGLLLALLLSCDSNSNIGVSYESAGITDQDLALNAPLSKEESLALYISQRGCSILSKEEVLDKILEGWNEALGSEVLENFHTANVETIWVDIGSEDETGEADSNETDQIPLYVFQKGGENGFVLVSGDVRLSEVFAYSSKGSYGTNTGTGLDVFNDLLHFYVKDSLSRFQAKYDSLLLSAKTKMGWTAELIQSNAIKPTIPQTVNVVQTRSISEGGGRFGHVNLFLFFLYNDFSA